MTDIKVNLTKMFSEREPWDCSNSAMNLGPDAGKITWENALLVARDATEWLGLNGYDLARDGTVGEACEEIRAWAKETGAWDKEERDGWTETECLALLVQNVASDLMNLGFEAVPNCAADVELCSAHCHECSYIMHMEMTSDGSGDIVATLYFGG